MSKKRKKIVLIASALLVLCALVFAFSFLLEVGAPSDEERVEAMALEALSRYNDQDWHGLAQLIEHDEGQHKVVEYFEGLKLTPPVKMPPRVREIKVEGDRASVLLGVETKSMALRGKRSVTLILLRQDGRWRIDFDASKKLSRP